MAEAVREASCRSGSRASIVEDVEVEPDPATPAGCMIRIDYRVRATNDRRNLVYPFYVIPASEVRSR